jgi:hypothetical protein
MRHSAAVGLAALNDALACASAAVTQAVQGDRGSASLSLLEARAAAEEAFGPGSREVDALNVVFSAIKQAADRGVPPPRPAWDLSRSRQERNLEH